ncbi:mechanosensitive ion channel family protein [Vitreimonas flagellata]|uniref:mechanosensitive ion channel family protein n=1 Tax=Vitreimonas flagellata TaxID=2560861 RepID=UPI001074BADB|nr:mechanosensitive ion channel domain-containing protein [Vitreimonas flagellata]
MIQAPTLPTTPPSTEPAAPAAPASATVDTLIAHAQDFLSGLFALDPEQALIRAGLTFLTILGGALLVWGLRTLLKALTERVAPEHAADPNKKRVPIGRWTIRIARFAIGVAVVLAILRIWGFDYADLREGPLGAVFGIATRVALILFVSFAAIEVLNLAIANIFARIAKRARNARRAAQVRTLAPLLSGIITTLFVLIAAMMTLSEFGVEIGPLIAGAGIVGLAVGFGAQTLVKDFLTGIFLIVEDTVSIGDIIGIGEFGGVVEDMSLRTIKLRDFDGTLHVFPYSEAQVIHNRTKSFSFAVFNLSVDYSADIPRAIDVMKETGAALRADPDFASLIIDDIEVVGVDQLADSAVVLKARIKTHPAKQWAVQREYLKRVKAAFDAAGVVIPFPTLKLIPPDGPARERD